MRFRSTMRRLSLEVNPITQKMFENQESIIKKQKELEDQLKKLPGDITCSCGYRIFSVPKMKNRFTEMKDKEK